MGGKIPTRGEISEKQFKCCYNLAKKVYAGKILRTEAVSEMSKKHSMNSSSANDYISFYIHLMNGTKFTRTINKDATQYYLRQILSDSGMEKLANAISSVNLHITYYENKVKSNLNSIRSIVESFQLLIDDKPEYWQGLVGCAIENDSKKELKEKIDRIDFDKDYVQITGVRIKRDAYAIALIKKLRDYKCQICKHTIKKTDGNFYIEAAHIIPSSKGGKESLDNILVLCPNHHKQLDVGNSSVTVEDGSFVVSLDEKQHTIPI